MAILAAGLYGCSEAGDGTFAPQQTPFIEEFEGPRLGSSEGAPPPPFPTEAERFAVCDDGLGLQLGSYAVSSTTNRDVGREVYVWISEQAARAASPTVVPLGTSTQWQDRLEAAAPMATEAERLRFPATFAGAGLETWPNAWATRLLTTEQRPRLLQLTLRNDARWLVVNGATTTVVDVRGEPVLQDAALASPELIAGVFLESPQVNDGDCGPKHTRTMVVTNAAAVTRWSIGGFGEVSHVGSDVRSVGNMLQWLRGCSLDVDFEAWAQASACSNYTNAEDPIDEYTRGLAVASPLYRPGMPELAHLADTLSADLDAWETSPFDVRSERIPVDDSSGDEPDAGGLDGGATASTVSDAGSVDAGVAWDASSRDAHVVIDTLGVNDAAQLDAAQLDAGQLDAGQLDAGGAP